MCLPTSSSTNPSVSLSSLWRDRRGKKREEGEEGNTHLLKKEGEKKKSLNYWLRRKFLINVDSPTRERAGETTEPRRDLGGHVRKRRPHLLLEAPPL